LRQRLAEAASFPLFTPVRAVAGSFGHKRGEEMIQYWDEFSKSLAETAVPRRQTLRLLGAALAGAILAPLGARSAWAGPPDPCKTFCNRYTRSRKTACLAACRACSGDTSRVCTSGSSFTCCSGGTTCCSGICTSLADDFDNCGACGALCADPGPYEQGACMDGHCFYSCAPGAVDCGGTCSDLSSDPDNCGACGSVCPETVPYCLDGICGASPCAHPLTLCGGVCVNLYTDWFNCGACGHECIGYEFCANGVCENTFPPTE
jgi:hypothetical protein